MDPIDLIWPKKCLGCQKPKQYLCAACLKKVPPAYSRAGQIISLWRYQGIIRKAIGALKYRFVKELAQELSAQALIRIRRFSFWPKKVILIPVPLHPSKLRQRGFNQAEEIGSLIAQKMNWLFVPDLILKIRKTQPQMELSRQKRLQNLDQAFKLNPKHKDLLNKNQLFIVFDDVLTTGATLREIFKILEKNGAKKVLGLTLAR